MLCISRNVLWTTKTWLMIPSTWGWEDNDLSLNTDCKYCRHLWLYKCPPFFLLKYRGDLCCLHTQLTGIVMLLNSIWSAFKGRPRCHKYKQRLGHISCCLSLLLAHCPRSGEQLFVDYQPVIRNNIEGWYAWVVETFLQTGEQTLVLFLSPSLPRCSFLVICLIKSKYCHGRLIFSGMRYVSMEVPFLIRPFTTDLICKR